MDSYNQTLSFISSGVFAVQSFIIPSDIAGNALIIINILHFPPKFWA